MFKRKIVLLIFFGVIPIQLSANNFSLNLGINHSWFVYPDVDLLESEFNPSYSIGFNSNQMIFQDIEFSYGVRFFNIGRYDEIKTGAIEETVSVNHKYLSLPIKIGYQINDNLIPFINIEPGIQVQSNFEHTNSLTPNEKKTITDEMNRFNIFAGLGVKYLFSINQKKFNISAMFNLGLLRVSKDEDFDVTENSSRSWADWRTREVLINIGYYFGT